MPVEQATPIREAADADAGGRCRPLRRADSTVTSAASDGHGLLTQFDIVKRGLQAFGHLQPQVYAPGIVPLSDIQLLEGMADYGARGGKNPDMMDWSLNGELAQQNTAWRRCSCFC